VTASTGDALALLRCLQLSSPGLPIGAYAYSQGLEWAVEAAWVRDETSLREWVREQMGAVLAPVDVAIYARLYHAVSAQDGTLVAHWNAVLLAHRETRELRGDDRDRGAALSRLLRDFGIRPLSTLAGVDVALATAHAQLAVHWALPLAMAVQAYVWAWLEGQVIAGVKLIPLGQAAGQRLLCTLAAELPHVVDAGLALDDDDIGGSLPALAIASCRHETQYTRLFRS
jgi:urease accessory protein